MKVLGILGSPRVNGTTAKILDRVIARFKKAKTEKIVLINYKIAPCTECGGCDKTGECVIKDDMEKIYRKIFSADVIILASPIFFMGLPSHVKAMIDRCQSIWIRKYVLKDKNIINKKKKGIFIAVAGSKRKDVFKGSVSTVKSFFATINADYSKEMLFPGSDNNWGRVHFLNVEK